MRVGIFAAAAAMVLIHGGASARTTRGGVTPPSGAAVRTLIVTAGAGWVQEEGGEKREIREGDVVWTPPGVKHWHGATATERLTHIAVQEVLDGKNVQWMEKVGDEQYRGKVAVADEPARSATSGGRVFEIRTYTTSQNLEVYKAFFLANTVKLFKKYGFEPIGYWIPLDPPRSENTFVHMLAFPDRETAKAKWDAFLRGPEWLKGRADFIAKHGKMLENVDSQFVAPVEFSPMK